MGRRTERDGIDSEPIRAVCDLCRHPHRCYVGGAPVRDDDSGARWSLRVCLGCLMRAGEPGGFETCADCAVTPAVAVPGTGHA